MYQKQLISAICIAVILVTGCPTSMAISNGETANHCEFPYVAYMDRVLFGDPVCSGIIINPEWVLTATYCLRFETTGISFTAGVTNVSIVGEGEQLSRVVATIIHPNFTQESTHGLARNDIALCKVFPPFDFSQDGVGPITLPNNEDVVNESLTLMGWGEINLNYEFNPVLQKADFIRESDQQCIQSYPNEWDATMLCASGTLGRVGICYGDTGSPLTYRREEDNRTALYGIASRYTNPACERNKSSMFTKVKPYVDWIQDTILNYNETDPISWAESINTCGGVLVGSAGLISYKVGQVYNSKETCVWTIRPTPGKRVTMAFKEYGIRSGGWVSKARIFDAEGLIGPNDKIVPGTSYGQNAEVIFITFYSNGNPSNGTGFALEFEGEMRPNPAGLNHLNDNYNLGSNTIVTVSHPSEIDDRYGSNEVSTWVVHNREVQTALSVNITRQDIDCGGDLLRIYSLIGNDASFRQDVESCGSVIPGRTFIAEDNVMIAVFKSDSIMERKGFAANFFQG